MRIRANQGHSVEVDLQLEPVEPPEILYHGTVGDVVKDIQCDGLKKMSRHAVHLSESLETATKVGARRGKPVILIVRAKDMHDVGYLFYKSDNGVWLTDNVPVAYIKFPD